MNQKRFSCEQGEWWWRSWFGGGLAVVWFWGLMDWLLGGFFWWMTAWWIGLVVGGLVLVVWWLVVWWLVVWRFGFDGFVLSAKHLSTI
jgi:hypothetical protein